MGNSSLWELNYLKSNLAYDGGKYATKHTDKMSIGVSAIKQDTLVYLLWSFTELVNGWDIVNEELNCLDSKGMISILTAINRILNTNYDYEFI